MDFSTSTAGRNGLPWKRGKGRGIEAFRVPENYNLFLTSGKIALLKSNTYIYLMPRAIAENILSEANGWTKYEKEGATQNDQKNAKVIIELLTNTLYSALQNSQVPDVKKEKNLATVARLMGV